MGSDTESEHGAGKKKMNEVSYSAIATVQIDFVW
jgi:hypothetical protein